MIREIKIYLALRPTISELRRLTNMKLSTGVVSQMLVALVGAYANHSDLLPPAGKFWGMIAAGAATLAIQVLGHYAPPPGTPAK